MSILKIDDKVSQIGINRGNGEWCITNTFTVGQVNPPEKKKDRN